MGTIYTSQVRDVKLTRITGRNVAHARRTAVERALLAADLHLGLYALVKPTIGQAADLLKVCLATSIPFASVRADGQKMQETPILSRFGRWTLRKAAAERELKRREAKKGAGGPPPRLAIVVSVAAATG